jgi:hypothetical protein
MPKYRVLKIDGIESYVGERFQIQYLFTTIFGREFWFNVGSSFPTEKGAVDYVKRLQKPYSEMVVWTSD